jgi:diguanylate cyclase
LTRALDIETARRTSDLAIKYMVRFEIVPTPDNYALWYLYASGTNEKLVKEIQQLIADREPFTDFLITDLRYRYIQMPQSDQSLDETSARVESEVINILGAVSGAVREADQYGATLNAATGALEDRKPDVGRIVANLLQSTLEMLAKNRALESTLNASAREVSALRKNLTLARKEASSDALTELCNRKAFDAEMRLCTQSANDTRDPLTLLLADVDKFKSFNDEYGHQIGDQVLRIVAKALETCAPPDSVCARIGGDEFAALLPKVSLKETVEIAERVRKMVESKKIIKRQTGEQINRITTSIGCALFYPGETSASFFRRADAALYAAKAKGRNCVVNETEPEAIRELSLKSQI